MMSPFKRRMLLAGSLLVIRQNNRVHIQFVEVLDVTDQKENSDSEEDLDDGDSDYSPEKEEPGRNANEKPFKDKGQN